MIVKLAQSLEWTRHKRKSRVVMAFRFAREDFLYETQHGWIQGYKGQWLVEFGHGLRCNLDHESFVRYFTPMLEEDLEE